MPNCFQLRPHSVEIRHKGVKLKAQRPVSCRGRFFQQRNFLLCLSIVLIQTLVSSECPCHVHLPLWLFPSKLFRGAPVRRSLFRASENQTQRHSIEARFYSGLHSANMFEPGASWKQLSFFIAMFHAEPAGLLGPLTSLVVHRL